MPNQHGVIVVGAGWAGLAAAVELARHNIPVTLLESAKQVGGRARRTAFQDNYDKSTTAHPKPATQNEHSISIDNGQHLLLGAYESILTLLRHMGVAEHKAFKRSHLYLHMLSPNQRSVHLSVGKLPAPLHLAQGILNASGISYREKFGCLAFSRAMAKRQFGLEQDMDCLSLLKSHGQSERSIKTIWEPLCLAALNCHPAEASAKIFLRTLKDSFTRNRADSQYLFPRCDLGSLFPDPAVDYIEHQGGHVRLASKVTDIYLQQDRVVGVGIGEQRLDTPYVILATPYPITRRLLSPHSILESLCGKLGRLESRPICTVYLQYPKRVSMGREITGFIDCLSQWAIDRSSCGNPGLIGVVISGNGPHMQLDNKELCQQVCRELQGFFPKWPKPEQMMVIREKQATFHSGVDVDTYRPGNRSAVNGLWLAGDYTDTGLPATLEGAVRSGILAAHDIINGDAELPK